MTLPEPQPAPGSLEALQARHGERHKWLVLLTVMVGTIASIMSSTIINVAIPDMSRSFTLGQERAQWVSAGFMAAMTLSMLTTPWLLARFGYRRTYGGAVLMLMIGGIVGGLAGSYELVLAMRVLEGLAAGVMQPIPAIIIMRAFPQHKQGRASGIFGFGVVLAPALGPSIGGFLVELFGWRSIFFVVVPFCLPALWLGRRYLPLMTPSMDRSRRLDWLGLALASAAVVCLMNGLVGLHDLSSGTAVVLLALVLPLTAAFLAQQRRCPQPLVDLRVFQWRQFAMGSVVSFIYGISLFGSTYLVPVYVQTGLGYSPTEAGLVLLPAGLLLALTIPLAGRAADRFAPAWLVAFGLALLALSFVLMPAVRPGGGFWLLLGFAAIGRIGLGFILPALNLGAMRGVAAEMVPQASSVISLLRQLGGALGISLTGIVLEARLAAHGASLVADGAEAGGRMQAFAEVFWLVGLLCALAIIGALRMRPRAAEADGPGEGAGRPH